MSTYQVSIEQVAEQPIAVARGRVTMRTIGKAVFPLLDKVWAFVKSGGVKSNGHNVLVYLDRGEGTPLIMNEPGVEIEAGAQVFAPFPDAGDVVCSKTPAGRVATTIHMGEYTDLPQAHRAVRQWCIDNHHSIAGINWEAYGHHEDDPAKRRTYVYYLLK
jgi:effector-binding domain-containing protein